jgi:hypothetical protein
MPPNRPAAPNTGTTPQLTTGHHRRDVGEPKRWPNSSKHKQRKNKQNETETAKTNQQSLLLPRFRLNPWINRHLVPHGRNIT